MGRPACQRAERSACRCVLARCPLLSSIRMLWRQVGHVVGRVQACKVRHTRLKNSRVALHLHNTKGSVSVGSVCKPFFWMFNMACRLCICHVEVGAGAPVEGAVKQCNQAEEGCVGLAQQ
jgi:hypothetical protein